MATMRKTYKYRLYPKKSQKTLLNKQLELCRWIYNESLALKKKLWEKNKVSLSLYDLNKKLTQWKIEKPELKGVHSQVLQKVQERIDFAYKAFFRRCKSGEKPGHPRFKGKNQVNSICFKQTGFSLDETAKLLKISKIGDIKVNYHRKVTGDIKTASIIRSPTGKYYVCFSIECEKVDLPTTGKIAGCDLGCKTLVTLSDGSKVENPKFLKQSEKRLAKHQKRKDEAKNAKNWSVFKKKKKIVAHIHEKILNQREDYAFQTANRLVRKYDKLFFENLSIDSMNSFAPVNKTIRDAAWGSLVQKVKFKAENAGKEVVLVNPAFTSKTCSRCKTVHEDFGLDKEFMDCSCGNKLQRDLNAAINILTLGLQSCSA